MIHILEGPDGVGKTTRALKLVQGGSWDLYKHCGPGEGGPEATLSLFKTLLQFNSVIDRSWPSEIAYWDWPQSQWYRWNRVLAFMTSNMISMEIMLFDYATDPLTERYREIADYFSLEIVPVSVRRNQSKYMAASSEANFKNE